MRVAMMDPEFFLLYAKRDDSFSVVPCSDVIFVLPVNVNDKVQFFYTQDGVRSKFQGVVKEFGDDYTQLKSRLPYWNKSRQPMNRPSTNRKSKKGSRTRKQEGKLHRRKQSEDKNKSQASEGSSDDTDAIIIAPVTDESDSSSDLDLTPEEIKAALQDAKRKRKGDFKSLSNFTRMKSTANQSDLEDDYPLSHALKKPALDLEEVQTTSPQRLNTPNTSSATQHVQDSSSSTSKKVADSSPVGSPDSGAEMVPVVRRKRRIYQKLVFHGTYYRFKEGDNGVEQLTTNYNVYVDSNELKHIKLACKSGPMMARLLVKAIYTAEACSECSPTGRPSGVSKKQRPPLDKDGINAALDFIKKRAEKRHWPRVTPTAVKKAFSDVLCEDRYTAGLLAVQRENDEEAAANAASAANAAAAQIPPAFLDNGNQDPAHRED